MTPFEIAKKELGQKEIPGPKSNPRILEYHQATDLKAGDEAVPWCASFICWAIDEAIKEGWKGHPSTKKAWARSFLNYGESVKSKPQVGDIVVLSRGKSKSQGHVGFFAGYTNSGLIKVLAGNQGDSVCYKSFSKANVLDIRRGAYKD